ncbi:tyrosine-type recombinase/integrase [Xanthobacter versatilis]|uniref:tyrosine-type recombinase/integrase n=1 Tax=Xanthobacter autotrophicus (strain ATCC BAA-1158 / Py2) TaxID=78245 RepID=UPI00372AE332
MTARQQHKKYLGDFTAGGVRHRRMFNSKEEAEAWELQSRANLALGKSVQRRQHAPAKHIASVAQDGLNTVQGLLEHVSRVYWAGTKSATTQVRNAQRFANFVGRKVAPEDAFGPEILGSYVSLLRASGCVGGTINRHLAAVSKMARVAAKARKIGTMPDIPWQREGPGRTLVFTRDEVDAILLQARQWGFVREADMFQFLVDTGCRLGEAEKVRWDDFTEGFRSVTFARDITKTASDRTIPLFPTSIEALKRRQRGAEHLPGPFHDVGRSRLRRVWLRIKAELKLDKGATIHTLRHTRCTWFAREGWDFWRIQKWMGHSALVTTRRYTNLVSNDLDAMVLGTPSPDNLEATSTPRKDSESMGGLKARAGAIEQRVALLQAAYGLMTKEQLVGLCVNFTLKTEGYFDREPEQPA